MDGGGSGFDASEIRAEVLRTVSGADERRTGVSDRLSVGRVAAVDLAEGGEEARILGSLSESVGDNRLTLVDVADFKVEGKLKSKSHSDAFMLGGSMVETFAGATLLLAGMSDDMVIGGGSRVTAPLDVTVGGLVGMEEKIGSAFADGFFSENAVVAFDREFGPGVHNCGTVVFEGHVLQTHATGFAPLMQTWLGVRNLNLGSHFSQGGQANSQVAPPPAAPPPVPPKMGGRGMLGALGGPANPASVQNMVAAADAADALEDLGDLGLVAEDTRAASNGAEAEVLADLRRGGEFVDLDGPGGARVAPAYEQTHGINAQTGLPETVTRPHRPELDNSDDDLMNVLSGGLFTSADARHEATGPGMVQPGAVQAPPPRVPSPDPSPPPVPPRSADGVASADTGADAGTRQTTVKWMPEPGEGEWIQPPADQLPGTRAGQDALGQQPGSGARRLRAEGTPEDTTAVDPQFYADMDAEDIEDIAAQAGVLGLSNRSAFDGVARNPRQSAELDQAARLDAAEDLRALEDEMLEMEWFKTHLVTADPVDDPELYASQMEDFEQLRAFMQQSYAQTDEADRNFRWLHRQAIQINEDYLKSFDGDPAQTRIKNTITQKVRRELRQLGEDYVAAAETFIRHQDPGPGGYARVAELDWMVETPMGTATFSDVSGGALGRTIDYLNSAGDFEVSPYGAYVAPDDVGNQDAYDLLRKLLVSDSDQQRQLDIEVEQLPEQEKAQAATVKRLENKMLAHQRSTVYPLERQVAQLQEQIDNIDLNPKGRKAKRQAAKEFDRLNAELAQMQADLTRATDRLDTMEEQLGNARITHGRILERLETVQDPDTLEKMRADIAWHETEQRYEFLIDTLEAAREDILAGRDPNVRLRIQADGYDELADSPYYRLAPVSDPSMAEELGVPGEYKGARKTQGAPLTLRDRAILSRLVADALADLAGSYGLDGAFTSSSTFDSGQLNYALLWGQLDDLADAAAGQSLPGPQAAASANRLGVSAAVPEKPPLRRVAGVGGGPSPGLQPSGAGSYDFASGAAQSPVDMARFEAEVVAKVEADPPAGSLADVSGVPLERVEVERPPGHQADDAPGGDDFSGLGEWGVDANDGGDLEPLQSWRSPDSPRSPPQSDEDLSGHQFAGETEGDSHQTLESLMADMEALRSRRNQWGSGQGPGITAEGSQWAVPTSAGDRPLTPVTPAALEPAAEVTPPVPLPRTRPVAPEAPPDVAPTPPPGTPPPPPRRLSRAPAPVPVDSDEWRGVTEAVPGTPSATDRPVPVPRTRLPDAPADTTPAAADEPPPVPPRTRTPSVSTPQPVETAPVPENRAGMFGPTAGGRGAEVRRDDLAYPSGAIDTGTAPELPPKRRGGGAESPPPLPEKQGRGGAETAPELPPKRRRRPVDERPPGWWADMEKGVDADTLPPEYVVDPPRDQYTAADGMQMVEVFSERARKRGRDVGFGVASAPGSQSQVYVEPNLHNMTRADYEELRAKAAHEYAKGGWDGEPIADLDYFLLSEQRMIFTSFDIAADEAALVGDDAAARAARSSDEVVYMDPRDLDFSDLPPALSMHTPGTAERRMVQNLDTSRTLDHLETADAMFLEDLRAGMEGVPSLQRKAAIRKFGDGDMVQMRGVYDFLAETAERQGRADDAAKYRRYVELIDSYAQARIARASRMISPGDAEELRLPANYFNRIDPGAGPEGAWNFSLASHIRGQSTDYLRQNNLLVVEHREGRQTLDQMNRILAIMENPNSRPRVVTDALSRAAVDAENGINPFVRLDMEAAYFEDLANKYPTKPNPYQERYDALREAHMQLLLGDEANQQALFKDIRTLENQGRQEAADKLKAFYRRQGFIYNDEIGAEVGDRAAWHWRMSPERKQAWLKRDPDNPNWWNPGRPPQPQVAFGGQQQPVLGQPAPSLKNRFLKRFK